MSLQCESQQITDHYRRPDPEAAEATHGGHGGTAGAGGAAAAHGNGMEGMEEMGIMTTNFAWEGGSAGVSPGKAQRQSKPAS
jgi:hypothetical protein